MKRSTFIRGCIVLIVSVCMIRGQTSAQHLITFASGEIVTDGLHLNWSLGEPITFTLHNSRVSTTQGYHQPMMPNDNCVGCSRPVSPRELISHYDQGESTLTILSNPTSSILNYKYESDEEASTLQYGILDALGRVIRTGQLSKTQESLHQTMDVSRLDAGQYYIRIVNGSKSDIQPFHIIR